VNGCSPSSAQIADSERYKKFVKEAEEQARRRYGLPAMAGISVPAVQPKSPEKPFLNPTSREGA
jgi:hypothetical protein